MSDYDRVHNERFALSLEAVQPHIHGATRVLELGGRGRFTELLEGLSADVHVYDRDLRKPFDGRLPANFDLIVCMEVFEHIHDRDEKPFATEWRATGTGNLLAEVFAHLKPGGLFFLTTPNACSLRVIAAALQMQPPMFYRPHVREYSPDEIVKMVKAAGFTIESFSTPNPWGWRPTPELAAFANKHFPSPHRGEDIFVLARKPS